MSRRSSCFALLPFALLLACGNDAPKRAPSESPSSEAPEKEIGARATAALSSIAETISDDDEDGVPNEIEGTATFESTSSGVRLSLKLSGCVRNRSYPIRILAAKSCDDVDAESAVWSPYGESIPGALCVAGSVDDQYVRKDGARNSWTLGAPRASDVHGRALVIYSPTGMEPLACGVIEQGKASQPSKPREPQQGAELSDEVRAYVGGLCATKLIARTTTDECPKPKAYADCAAEHCELDSCIEACADYASCLKDESDPCAGTCPQSDACAACVMSTFQCVLGSCPEVVACAAPPTPGGPCSKVEACCMQQGDRAGFCLDLLRQVERLSGDPSCEGLLNDWDFLENIANDPPCMPE